MQARTTPSAVKVGMGMVWRDCHTSPCRKKSSVSTIHTHCLAGSLQQLSTQCARPRELLPRKCHTLMLGANSFIKSGRIVGLLVGRRATRFPRLHNERTASYPDGFQGMDGWCLIRDQFCQSVTTALRYLEPFSVAKCSKWNLYGFASAQNALRDLSKAHRCSPWPVLRGGEYCRNACLPHAMK